MKASIVTGKEESSLVFDNLESVKDEVSCHVDVHSGGFAARRPFYFSRLSRMISDLEGMDRTLKGRVVFTEDSEESEITLECDKFGHVIVSGALVVPAEQYHLLKFSFVTDQTCLMPFIRDLSTVQRTDTGEPT